MKTTFATLVALLVLPWTSSAAPRLVVSTPSLVPESQIDLILDRPVVATADLGKTVDNTWLEIKPALPGKIVWKAQNIASFLLDEPPALGTTYTFSIPQGKIHLDRSEVPAGKFATHGSDPFRVQSASSLTYRYSENYSASTATWLVFFNDDVDPVKAAGFVSFHSDAGQQIAAKLERPTFAQAGSYALRYKPWSARFKPIENPPEIDPSAIVPNAFLATPVSPLPPGTGWKLSVLKGLPNAASSATQTEDGFTEIGAIEPFKVTNIKAIASPDQPRKIVITFNHPVPDPLPAELIDQSLSLTPKPEDLSAESRGRQIILSGNFSEAENWMISIRPPFTSATGLPLVTPITTDTSFPPIDPELLLPSENQAQLSSGSRSYPVQTINLEKIHLRIKSLSAAQLVRAYQGYRNYTGTGPDYKAIQPTAPLPYSLISGTPVVDQEIILDNPIDTSKNLTLLWDELLPKNLRNAALFIDIVGTPKSGLKQQGRRNVQAIIQLTDIGLAWKLSNSEAFVYAFSCTTGQPLKDVAIDLFGEDSATIRSVKTDATGLATLPRPADARHLRAVLADDSFVTEFDSTLNTVGLWHFPVRYSWNKAAETTRRAFLFTDRSLYRPGETVRLKGIIRTQSGNAIESPVASPARLVILDPTEKEIFTTPVTISETGAFDLTYQLPAEKTGTHLIRLEHPEELAKATELEDDWQAQENLRSSASFEIQLRVEEFRRNAFEIEQTLAEPGHGATQISAELSARYYQGQPVAAGKVKHFTRVTAENPYPERFRDFLFGNHRSEDWSYWYHYFGYRSGDGGEEGDESNSISGPVLSQGETRLSPEGKTTLSLEIPQAEFPTGREVTVSTEVTDANNQTLTASTTVTVHPAAIYVGISRNDRLIRAGEAVDFKIVAIDPGGNPYPNPVNLTATLTREVNSAVRSRNEQGDTITRNDAREENVLTSELTLDPANSAKDGQPLTISPTQNGRHFLTLRGIDADGRSFATVTSFTVYGANDYPWLYEDGLRVKLVPEKKSHKAGDTARILVLSPIEGTALVTIEREKVLRSFLTTLKADKPVIEIPITEDDAPNAFVSVLIVKGAADSARGFKSPQLRLGYCELTVENQRDRLAVTLQPDAPECRPGDEVTLTGTVTLADGSPAAGTELTLYAEDEGTLAVMGYETPDPMAFFYNPRRLAIDVGISFENFISEDPDQRGFYNKGFFIGGGGDLGKLADLYRKNFDPCATWAPVVKADADGNFTHTFKTPDTLTRYRLIAVAHHGVEKFGHAESQLIVNKSLMIEPKAPRFANQGDTFSPQVLIQNASPHDATWEVTMTSRSIDVSPICRPLTEPTQTITLNAGASATLVFPVTAESTGTAILAWKATPVSLGNGKNLTPDLTRSLSDAVETRFEINYPMPLLRQVKFVKIDRSQNLLDHLDPALISGTGEIQLEFSRSPLSEISGSVEFLLSYPHGCVEQTTSSLMPWFAVNSMRSIVPAFAKTPEENVKTAIQKGTDRLLSMQLPDGSFAYWPGGKDRVDWATSYAGLGLVLAKQQGANVPQSAIDSLTNNLIESLRGIADVKSPSILEHHARALWVLALAEKAQPAYQNVLNDRIADLTPSARAFLALAIKTSGGTTSAAKAVLNSKAVFRLKNDSWMRWDASDSLKLLALTTIDHADKETTSTLDRLLNERNPYGHWRTTWVNGWSLLALSTFAENEKTTPTDWTAEFVPPAGLEKVTLTADNPTATRSVKITPGLDLTVSPTGPAYVRIRVAAQPKIEPVQPVATNGLSIDRIYERIQSDGSAEILTEPKLGDLIKVTLRVTLPKDDTKYLVIEDLLPSVFETVNTDFKSQTAAAVDTPNQDWRISHSELRTDRAVFYLDQIWRRGTYTLTYFARCTVPGQAYAPPAKAESMYDPEFYALSASRLFSTK